MRIRPYIKDGNRLATERSKPTLSANATPWEKQERLNYLRAIKKAYRHQLKRETDDMVKEYYVIRSNQNFNQDKNNKDNE